MTALLEVALFLALGRVLSLSGRLPRETPAALTSWILYVAWPAAALQSARSVRMDATLWSGVAWLWLLFAVAMLVVGLFSLWFGLRRPTAGAVLLASGAGSTAGFALPFVDLYCGPHCMGPAIVLSVLGGALAFSVLGTAASCILSQGRVCVATMARRIFTFPPLVALVIGLVVPRTAFPQVVMMAAHDVAATLAPIAIVAGGMHLRGLPDRARLGPVVGALSFRLLVAPAAMLLGVTLFGPSLGSFGKLLVLLAAMPPLVSSIAVAREYQLEPELTAQIAALGASLALVTIPFWGAALEILT